MNYIALDIGNVLCRINFDKIIKILSKYTNLSKKEVEYNMCLVQKMNDIGIVDIKFFLYKFLNIKSESLIEEIIDIWNKDVLIFDNFVIDFFETFRMKHGLKVALLSNIGTDHSIIVDNYFNNLHYEYSVFSNAIKHYSCDIGVRKPQSLFYRSFLLENEDFKECVYLDDCVKNLEASLKFGFKAVEFDLSKTDYNSLKLRLNAIGNLILNKD